jgi:hypothetical protein
MTGTRPPERFRPLRELGIVVMVLLALIVAMIVAQLGIWLVGQVTIGWSSAHLVSWPAPPLNDTIPLVAPAAW